MTRWAFLFVILLFVTFPSYAQSSKPKPQRETWYERALRQINPNDTDYGALWEERKRAFMSQFGNPYFQYSLAATVATVALLTVSCAQRISHKRALGVAAQSIADVLRHDEHSRRAAREAIRRYNDHIEACNRSIETGKSLSAAESELRRLRQELADTHEENRKLRNELAKKPKNIAEAPPQASGEQQHARQMEMEFATAAQYIAQIKALERQLRAEQKKNQQAKGTSVHDHRA